MKTNNRRLSSQAIDKELSKAIEEHLHDDINITIRSLVRKMKLVNNASSITRCPKRSALVEIAKKEQVERRLITAKIVNSSASSNKHKLAKLELALSEALKREENLKVAFGALIKAAAIHGVNWASLFEIYHVDLSLLPSMNNITLVK